MSESIFKGFKQVLKEEYDAALTGGTAIGYIWFVRPDAKNDTEGDIYLGTRHYGHYGKNDLNDLTNKIANICNSVGLVSDGTFEGFTTDIIELSENFADAIDTIAAKVNELTNSKISSITSGSQGIKIDGNTTDKTISLLLDNSGEVQFTQSESGLKGNVKINSSDKVLSSDGTELKTTIGLKYGKLDSGDTGDTKYIILTGKDDQTIASIDATEFIKDGMLESAKLETNPTGQTEGTYIVLTFNTASGKAEPIYINVTSLIDVYLAGDGLSLSDHTFSVKVKDADKYLEVTSNGLASKGIDEALELKVDKEEGSRLITNEEAEKLSRVEDGAQVNKIESITINGVDASVEGKKATAVIDSTKISVGKDITNGEEVVYTGDTKLDAVLQGIQDSINTISKSELKNVKAGAGISVTEVLDHSQTISAKVSSDEGNILKIGTDGGLFCALYYSGNDVETEI